MRIEAVAIVKNEADIIESFVRHHTGLLDRLWVIDNMSTDATPHILNALRDEGLPLHVSTERRSPHPQEEVMSEVVAGWTADTDWLFLLDADEFIDIPSRADLRAVLHGLDPATVHLLPWDFMVPTPQDDPGLTDPVVRIRHRRDAPTPHFLSKVLIPRVFLGRGDIRVAAGNHLLRGPEEVRHRAVESLRLAHFPIRSAEQLARKTILGAWAIAARVHRMVGENHHWRHLRDAVVTGELPDGLALQRAAANYAEPEPWQDWPLIERPLSGVRASGRYAAAEPDWRQYLIEYADAHFRALEVQILDQPALVKTVRGIVACPAGDEADLLRLHGDMAPDLVALAGCMVEEGDTIVHRQPGSGYLSLGLSRLTSVVAVPDDRENWMRTNLVLSGGPNVRVGDPSGTPDLHVGAVADPTARRQLLIGPAPVPHGWTGMLLWVRREPYRDYVTGAEVECTREPLQVTVALREGDPLCADLAPHLNAPGRVEGKRVIETLIMRRRMRRYKRAVQNVPMTDLERRVLLEEQLQADPFALDLVAAGQVEALHAHIRQLQPGIPDTAVYQLELQLRLEVVRSRHSVPAALPTSQEEQGLPTDEVTRIVQALDDAEHPLRPLIAFEPVSRVYRKGATDRVHVLDRPEAAVCLLRALRRAGVTQAVAQRLGAPPVVTLESVVTGPCTFETGVGRAILATGAVAPLEPGQQHDDAVVTVWFFSAGAVPAGQEGVLA